MNTKKGFITAIVIIIVALILLGYFNIDIKAVFSSPLVKDNLQYAWDLTVASFHALVTIITNLVSSHPHIALPPLPAAK